jgi:hypothetical protein
MPNPKKVFVIHGRNEDARRAMFAFLRCIGLEPLEWGQAVAEAKSPTPYIGDVLDRGMGEAQAIVVLFTGDDVARLGSSFGNEPLSPQARPNVIFEAGMSLGRFPERTILVRLGEVRDFSDIAGRHVVEMNDSAERRQQLVSRLQSVGCDVAVHGTDWYKEGAFNASIVPTEVRKLPVRRTLVGALSLILASLLVLLALYRPSLGPRSPEQTAMRISGTILRRGLPLSGALVGVLPGTMIPTDSAGRFRVIVPQWAGQYAAVVYDAQSEKSEWSSDVKILGDGTGTFDYTFPDSHN